MHRSTADAAGDAVMGWKTSRSQAAGTCTVRVTAVVKDGYQFGPANSVTSVSFVIQ